MHSHPRLLKNISEGTWQYSRVIRSSEGCKRFPRSSLAVAHDCSVISGQRLFDERLSDRIIDGLSLDFSLHRVVGELLFG